MKYAGTLGKLGTEQDKRSYLKIIAFGARKINVQISENSERINVQLRLIIS
jgi:hypothetical protein